MSGSVTQIGDVRGRELVQDSADVVIVGSGAAGATSARVLTEAGLDVVVVEEGPRVPTAELRSDMYSTFRRMWRDGGFQLARGRTMTPILQGSVVGGTTVINGAIIHRLPPQVFDSWCRERGVDRFMRYEDLDRVQDQLDRELCVGTAPNAAFGRQNELMEQGVAAMGWRGNRVRRNVDSCDGSAHCNQGCPKARRQSMDNSYIPRSLEQGARIYATCRVQRVLSEGGRATGVVGRFVDKLTGERGPELRIHARHAVVLAASAIQTPLLLADSGLGNRRMLGQHLQAHPGTAVAGVFDDPVKQWFGAAQGYESTHFWDERMKLETVAMPLELAAVRLPGFGAELVRELHAFDKVAFFGVQIRARAHGRVSRNVLGHKSIAFDPTDADVRTLKTGVMRLAELMFAAGARQVLPGIHGLPERVNNMDEMAALQELPDDPRLFHCIAAHLFGTAMMGTDPRSSVVRPDCRLHDVEGLYVTDSSVFPSNLGVNPQHSICAVSWLAAENIAETAHAGRRKSGSGGALVETTLKDMLDDEQVDIAQVAAHLDGIGHDARLAQTFALGRAGQRRLWELAAAAAPLEFDHFVPPGVASGGEVRHLGKNTLPLPRKHKYFQKRFTRSDDGSSRLFGYNQGPSTRTIGPGYFVAVPTEPEPDWHPRGAIVVDYFQVPEAERGLPESWPAVVPNSQGLQRFVYHRTRDFMRGVSDHISIGAAYKGERALDHYFVLVREPRAVAAQAA